MVPSGWDYLTLESLCDSDAPITYGVLKPGDYVADGVPLLQIKDLLSNLSELENLHRISSELDEQYKRSKIKTNDILISLVGTIGRIAIVPKQLNNANIHRNLGRIRVKNFQFLYHYLQSDIAKNRFGISSSGSSQSALNLTVLRSLKVPVPPLPEQQKIAKILTTWDKAIDTTDRLIENSKQQKKALMQQLLTGQKRLLDDSGQHFSGDWEEAQVSDYFEVGSSKRVLQEDWQESGVPFYRTRELISLAKKEPFNSSIFISEKLYKDIIDKYGMPSEDDFLVSGVGTLGIIYQVKNGDKFYFKDGNVLWFKKKSEISSDFFKYMFLSDFVQHQIDLQSSVTTVGTYTIKNAKVTKFLCPPIQEQQKIAAVLTTADREIEVLEQQLADLQQEKKALMQQLLTGKKRVKVD